MDKTGTGIGVVGRLTLRDGETLTVEISSFDEESDELLVNIIPSDGRAIALDEAKSIQAEEIVSFDPQPSQQQRWPYSDPCRRRPLSFPRVVLLGTIFLLVVPAASCSSSPWKTALTVCSRPAQSSTRLP